MDRVCSGGSCSRCRLRRQGAPSTSFPTYMLFLLLHKQRRGEREHKTKKRVSCSSFFLLWSLLFFQVPIFCSSFVWSPICPCLLEKGMLGSTFYKFARLLVSGYPQLEWMYIQVIKGETIMKTFVHYYRVKTCYLFRVMHLSLAVTSYKHIVCKWLGAKLLS